MSNIDLFKVLNCNDQERIDYMLEIAELLRSDKPIPLHLNIFLAQLLIGLADLYQDKRKPDKKTHKEILSPIFEWSTKTIDTKTHTGYRAEMLHNLLLKEGSKAHESVLLVSKVFNKTPKSIRDIYKKHYGCTPSETIKTHQRGGRLGLNPPKKDK